MNAALPQGPAAADMHTLKAIQQFESQPLEQRYPWTNTWELIMHACNRWGDDTALEFLATGVAGEATEAVSFRQLAERINQTANLLHSLGVGTEDAVSILLPTLPENYYATWGSQAAGITSPLNPMLDARHLAEIMTATGSRVLVTTAPMADNPALWETTLQLVRQLPQLTHLLIVTRPGLTGPMPAAPRDDLQMIDFNAALPAFNGGQLDSRRRFHGNEAAAYMHTGGTTGQPKVARINHSNFAFVAQLTADMGSGEPRFNSPCALPLFHIFGLVITGISAFVAGNNLIILSPAGFRNPNVVMNFWSHVERFRFKGVAAVPTILSILYDIPVGDHDVSSLEEILSGAAPLPDQLKLNFEGRYGCRVRNGYGMTETSCVLSLVQKDTVVPLGSCGLRLPYAERIIAHVDGQRLVKICGPRETGVILTRGPNIFAGYLQAADNEGAWVENWFNTGDMGYQDEDGFLFLTGRAKDLIIRGGHNIDPAVIEEPLLTHPDIAAAVAIGQPDVHAGEVPIAYVVLKAGHQTSPEALLEFAQEEISERAAIPRRIAIIDAIPLTAVGKIFKPRLREMATEFALHATLKAAGVSADLSVSTDTLKGLTAGVRLHDSRQLDIARQTLQALPVQITFEPGA